MLALLNQATHSAGQGNINPVLYRLAANPESYAAAFHDITGGGNQCDLGAASCSSAAQASYAAGGGYDQASGLGSVDLAKLVAAWPSTGAAGLVPTQTQVGVESFTQGAASSQLAYVTVTPLVYGTATGTVRVLLDGSVLAAAAPLSGTLAQIPYTVPASSGSHVVTAIYSGDAHNAPSIGSGAFSVGSSTATGNFALSSTNITLAANGTGTGTITVIPQGGYTGAVSFSLSSSAKLSGFVLPAGSGVGVYGHADSDHVDTWGGNGLLDGPGGGPRGCRILSPRCAARLGKANASRRKAWRCGKRHVGKSLVLPLVPAQDRLRPHGAFVSACEPLLPGSERLRQRQSKWRGRERRTGSGGAADADPVPDGGRLDRLVCQQLDHFLRCCNAISIAERHGGTRHTDGGCGLARNQGV